MPFLYKQRMYFVWLKSSNLLFHINFWCCSVPRHMGLEPGRLCFGFTVQCMGICCHLGPGVYLQCGFTSEGITLDGFNSIILLFIFSLSHVLSFHVSFYPWLLCDWVVFMIPFYIPCQYISCHSFLWSGCIKSHGMHLYLASWPSSDLLLLYM